MFKFGIDLTVSVAGSSAKAAAMFVEIVPDTTSNETIHPSGCLTLLNNLVNIFSPLHFILTAATFAPFLV
jgi:hypothetical protein